MKRLKPGVRKADILKRVMPYAALAGYSHILRHKAARAAGVSPATVQYHFLTMRQFKRDLMQFAVQYPDTPGALWVIAQGLAVRDGRALRASVSLKKRALSVAVV